MSHAPSNPVSGIRYTKPRATVNSRNYQKRIQSKCSKKLPRQTPRCAILLASRSRSDLARNSSALPMHNLSSPNRHRNSSRKAFSVATGPGSTMPCPFHRIFLAALVQIDAEDAARQRDRPHMAPKGLTGRVRSAALPIPDEQPAI